MKKYLILLFGVVGVFITSSLWAVRVNSIYQANIPVTSQSPDQRTQFSAEGLAQVLIKVSGNSHILDNSRIKSHLKEADELTEEFSYSPSPATPATPYILHIRFNTEAINRILRNADVATWGQNRPLIMLWAEYEVPDQAAVIIDSDSTTDLNQSFKKHAEQRGLPIILPMMDMMDINKVSVNDIVMMTLPTLQSAAKRYNSDAVLIVRVFKNPNDFFIQSKLVMGAVQWSWDLHGKSLDEVTANLFTHVSDVLAGRYATVVSNSVQSQLILKIVNITEPDDFGTMMEYISHLTPVADVEPVRIDGDTVSLKISLRGSKDALIQALSIGQKLEPIAGGNGDELEYQWNH
jgi:hypothetical protein